MRAHSVERYGLRAAPYLPAPRSTPRAGFDHHTPRPAAGAAIDVATIVACRSHGVLAASETAKRPSPSPRGRTTTPRCSETSCSMS
jgi:hypothetical protein